MSLQPQRLSVSGTTARQPKRGDVGYSHSGSLAGLGWACMHILAGCAVRASKSALPCTAGRNNDLLIATPCGTWVQTTCRVPGLSVELHPIRRRKLLVALGPSRQVRAGHGAGEADQQLHGHIPAGRPAAPGQHRAACLQGQQHQGLLPRGIPMQHGGHHVRQQPGAGGVHRIVGQPLLRQ